MTAASLWSGNIQNVYFSSDMADHSEVGICAENVTGVITQQQEFARCKNVGMYLSLTGAGKGVPVTHDSTHHSFFTSLTRGGFQQYGI